MSALKDITINGRYYHGKSGGTYRVTAIARVEANPEERVVVYTGPTGTWTRPLAEFMDGRFQPVDEVQP